jgi:hypothetical protein
MANRFRSLEINYQLEPSGLLHWYLGRFGAAKYLRQVTRWLPVIVMIGLLALAWAAGRTPCAPYGLWYTLQMNCRCETRSPAAAVHRDKLEHKPTWRGHRECAAVTSSRLACRERPAQQVRQLGDVGGDAPGLVAGAGYYGLGQGHLAFMASITAVAASV